MSGGRFDYGQYQIMDIINSIEDYLDGHDLCDEDIQGYEIDYKKGWIDEDTIKYIRKHKHTIPNNSGFSKETLKEFRKGLAIIRKAYVYAQRIDWLLCGDDEEETFHESLKDDLEHIKTSGLAAS